MQDKSFCEDIIIFFLEIRVESGHQCFFFLIYFSTTNILAHFSCCVISGKVCMKRTKSYRSDGRSLQPLFSWFPGESLLGRGKHLQELFFFCEQTGSSSLKSRKWICQNSLCLYTMNMFKSSMEFSSNCVLRSGQKYTFPKVAPRDKE